jgi:hypothetical protein
LRTRRAGEVLMRAVEEEGLAGVMVVEVVVGGEEERREEGEGEGDVEGARRRRRRSVASEGVRTGRVDQDAAVESEVVERAGEEAVKVAWEVVSGVDVDGDVVEVCEVEFDGGGCSTLEVVSVLPSFFSCSALSVAPATACS